MFTVDVINSDLAMKRSIVSSLQLCFNIRESSHSNDYFIHIAKHSYISLRLLLILNLNVIENKLNNYYRASKVHLFVKVTFYFDEGLV